MQFKKKIFEYGVLSMVTSCVLILVILLIDGSSYIISMITSFDIHEAIQVIQTLIEGGNYLQVTLILIWTLFFLGLFFVLCSLVLGFFSNLFIRKKLLKNISKDITINLDDVAIVIPVYNEEETIEKIVIDCKKYSNHIVVVNDGSTDKTTEILAKISDIHVLSHKTNLGLGKTMKDGIKYAANMNIKVIVTFDADGQYRVTEIPKIAYPIISKEADLVLGSRFAGKIEKMSRGKRLGNKMMSFALSIILGFRVTDGQTGFRGISLNLAQTYRLRGEYTYTQEMIIQARFLKKNIVEVPIFFDRRISGSSRLIRSPIDYAWKSWLTILRTLRDFQPIWFFGGIGIVSLLLGLFFFSISAVSSVYISLPFDIAIFSTILLLVGMQFVFFGFLADANRPID
ncbi:MAG: glycosyltransferase family 2 protein [Candidatus Hodarchaeales archaeon]